MLPVPTAVATRSACATAASNAAVPTTTARARTSVAWAPPVTRAVKAPAALIRRATSSLRAARTTSHPACAKSGAR